MPRTGSLSRASVCPRDGCSNEVGQEHKAGDCRDRGEANAHMNNPVGHALLGCGSQVGTARSGPRVNSSINGTAREARQVLAVLASLPSAILADVQPEQPEQLGGMHAPMLGEGVGVG
eukprot:CAMPEP_0115050596 /NCGR_PEP_ID=MMETSP0227-20121206/1869_1 /TAXON_ID=89957 /ORGANISM="Polarella glacialis, Strain CCMP 1383" /LENGTH=117 /DNA_ID=CAMNT_0002434463 /DNA_START=221 /DNA_END=571 /DNA_ORIENTATION=+